jgi:RNA polymerase sigma-70 factor, ECF subfamily
MATTATWEGGESLLPLCEDAPGWIMGPERTARAGQDAVDFDSVYEQCLPFVWRTARRMGVAPEFVEDVCQEVFLIVHRRLPEYEGRSSIRTWVFGVLQNVVRTHRRSLARKSPAHRSLLPLVDPAEIADEHPRAEDQVALSQAEILAQRILDEMDEKRRVVFVLADIEEVSLDDIAVVLGIPRSTVVARLRAARAQFAAGIRRARARDEWRLG